MIDQPVNYLGLHECRECRERVSLDLVTHSEGFAAVTRCRCGTYSTEYVHFCKAQVRARMRSLLAASWPVQSAAAPMPAAPKAKYVYFKRDTGSFRVHIGGCGPASKGQHLGMFPTFDEAVAARDAYLLKAAA